MGFRWRRRWRSRTMRLRRRRWRRMAMRLGRRGVIRLVMVRSGPGLGAVMVTGTMAMISPGGRRGRRGSTEVIIIVTIVKWKLSLSLLNLADFFF